MATPNKNIARGLGAKLLAVQGQGGNYPKQVRAAARRMVQGSFSKADVDLVRNALGVQKTGATENRKQFREATTLVNDAMRVQADIEQIGDVAARGGNVLSAVGRLSRDVADGVRDAVSNKFVQKTAQTLAKKWFGTTADDVTRKLYGLRGMAGKVAGMAGPLGWAADFGWAVGSVFNARTDARLYRNRNAGLAFDLARQNNFNVAMFSLDSQKIRDNTAAQQTWGGRLGTWMGWDKGLKEEQDRRIDLRAKNMTRAMAVASELGLHPDRLIAAYARSIGKLPDDLSPEDRAAALYEVTSGLVGGSGHEDDPRVLARLQKKSWGDLDTQDVFGIGSGTLPTPYGLRYKLMTSRQQQIERQKIYEEEIVPEEKLAPAEVAKEERRKRGQVVRTALFDTADDWLAFWNGIAHPPASEGVPTPGTWENGKWITSPADRNFLFRREQETFSANQQAELNRRKVVEYD